MVSVLFGFGRFGVSTDVALLLLVLINAAHRQPAQALLTDLPDDEADESDEADAIDDPEPTPALAAPAPQLGPRPPALPTLKLARAVPPMVTITSQRDRDRSLEVSIEVTAPDDDGREGRP